MLHLYDFVVEKPSLDELWETWQKTPSTNVWKLAFNACIYVYIYCIYYSIMNVLCFPIFIPYYHLFDLPFLIGMKNSPGSFTPYVWTLVGDHFSPSCRSSAGWRSSEPGFRNPKKEGGPWNWKNV